MSRARRKPRTRSVSASAPIFAALGDETRLALVAKLSGGAPLSIARLTEGSSVTRQAITKHLRVLQEVGMVRGVRNGRENRFELDPKPIDEARRVLELMSRQWDDALARLKAFVEE